MANLELLKGYNVVLLTNSIKKSVNEGKEIKNHYIGMSCDKIFVSKKEDGAKYFINTSKGTRREVSKIFKNEKEFFDAYPDGYIYKSPNKTIFDIDHFFQTRNNSYHTDKPFSEKYSNFFTQKTNKK
jgi:hypothetical protein